LAPCSPRAMTRTSYDSAGHDVSHFFPGRRSDLGECVSVSTQRLRRDRRSILRRSSPHTLSPPSVHIEPPVIHSQIAPSPPIPRVIHIAVHTWGKPQPCNSARRGRIGVLS